MIKSVADIAKAYGDGKWHVQNFLKVWPSTYSTANAWWDATMSGSTPRASYYSGDDYKFTVYPADNHLTINHGGNVSPAQKILRSIHLFGNHANLAPSRYILCDFLGFYTGISWETDQVQGLNNATTLPRYTDGKGVRAFMVQLFGNNANAVYTINYRNTLNQDVTTQNQTANALSTGALQHARTSGNYNPFIDINNGDAGIKRVNSVTVSSLGAGVAVLVLVKPIGEIIFRDSTLFAPVEKDFFTDNQLLPIIYDGACLNFLFTSVASPTTRITQGYCDFIWG